MIHAYSLLVILGIIIFIILLIVLIHLFRFKGNPGLCIFMGVPGTGKTTLCAYFTKKWNKQHIKVYSNAPILGSYKINPKDDLGVHLISQGNILIDEANMEFGNREWAKFGQNVNKFSRYFRQYQIARFYFFSQGLDIDLNLVRLARKVYILEPFIPHFVLIKGAKKITTIDDQTQQIIYGYKWDIFDFHIIFSPPLYKSFKTCDPPPLPEKVFETWDTVTRY